MLALGARSAPDGPEAKRIEIYRVALIKVASLYTVETLMQNAWGGGVQVSLCYPQGGQENFNI